MITTSSDIQNFRRSWLFTVSIVAVLVVMSGIGIYLMSNSFENDETIVNVSGRQRMLSQRVSKYSLLLVQAVKSQNKELIDQTGKKLKQSIDLWNTSHTGLENRDDSLNLGGKNSNEVKVLFAELNHSFVELTV